MNASGFFHRVTSLLSPLPDGPPRRRRARGAVRPARAVEPLENRLCLTSLTLSGNFEIETIETLPFWDPPGDIASTPGLPNHWTCRLDGVSYDTQRVGDVGTTRVHAESFQFQFSGADAAVLNDVATPYFVHPGGPFLTLRQDHATGASSWYFAVAPLYPVTGESHLDIGVALEVYGQGGTVPTDANGCPVVGTMSLEGSTTVIHDNRVTDENVYYTHSIYRSFDDRLDLAAEGEPEPRPPLASVSDVSVTEGNGGTAGAAAVFTVSLSAASAAPVTVEYATEDATAVAGRDYDGAAGVLTFAPGETSKAVAVPVRGDATDEYDETFVLALRDVAGAVPGDTRGTATVLDDDAPPTVSVSDVSRVEGGVGTATPFHFVVTLSAPSEKVVTVGFATADGTARVSDGDYAAASGTLTFAAGETRGTVTVLVRGDKRKEGYENFSVNLFNAGNAIIGDGRGVGTILDDDLR